MWNLVLRHEVTRSLGKPVLIAGSTATFALNLLIFAKATRDGAPSGWGGFALAFVILVPGLVVLLMQSAGRRAAPWSLALPLPAHRLWAAHLRALVLGVSILMAVLLLVLGSLAVLIGKLEGDLVIPLDSLLLAAARPYLVLVLVAAGLALFRPGLADPGASGAWGRWRLFVGVAALVLLALLLALPLPVALVPALVMGAMLARTRRSLPAALSLAEQPEASVSADTGVDGRGSRVLQRVVVRQLFKWPTSWIVGLPMMIALGLLMGGVVPGHRDGSVLRYFNVLITVYMLVAFNGHFVENLWRVDHLPVGRHVMLRWLILPSLAALLVGALAGAALAPRPGGETLVYENDPAEGHFGLRVPVDVWEVAGGNPPEFVTAPWGENGAVAAVAVVQGAPLHLWKTYTTTEDASADFVAWQISRAAERVHGVSVPADTIAARYLVQDDQGRVTVREDGLTLVADGLVTPRAAVGPVLPLLLGATIGGSLLVTWLTFSLCGTGSTARRVRTVFWTGMGLLLVFHMSGYVLLMAQKTEPWHVEALVLGLAGSIGGLGVAGWVGSWLAFLVIFVVGWRLALRAFLRVEAVRSAGCGGI